MKVEVHPADAIDPRRWDAFVRESPQASVYALHGYASAIRPGWRALIVRKGETWKAVMPLAVSKKWRYQAVLQPFFAQHWGVMFAPAPTSLSHQKRCLQLVLEELQDVELFAVNFSPRFAYPLPFYWENYQLHTRYTYQLSLTPTTTELWQQLAASLKRQVMKAERNGCLLVPIEPRDLMALIRQNKSEGKDLLGEADPRTFETLCTYALASGLGTLKGLRAASGQLLAGALFVDFLGERLYLQGAFLPGKGDSGAMSSLMWQALLDAKAHECHVFDFEGSMISGIESFFRKFGAQPVPYLHIYRNKLPTLIQWIRELR